VGVQPHHVRLAEVAEPEPPAGELLEQAVTRNIRKLAKLAIRMTGIARRWRLLVGDCIVPPWPVQAAGGSDTPMKLGANSR
jgi:hypothetical protein